MSKVVTSAPHLPISLALLALAVIAFIAFQLIPPRDEAWERIQQTRTLAVVTDASYPPFAAIDVDGNLFGFDIDLAEEIGRRLGARVAFENLTYDALLGAVIVGRDDVVISAFVPQPDRTRDVAYTRPYFVSGTALVISATAAPAGEDVLAWVAGKTLAVEYGATGDALARQWARQAANITVLPLPTAFEALQAVETNTASAAVVDALAAYDYLRNTAALTLTGPLLEPEPYVIAVSIKSPRLLAALDQALAAMEADGTLGEMRMRWFGEIRDWRLEIGD
jgi:ABC-type amino acid transport substrate-binding protein